MSEHVDSTEWLASLTEDERAHNAKCTKAVPDCETCMEIYGLEEA